MRGWGKGEFSDRLVCYCTYPHMAAPALPPPLHDIIDVHLELSWRVGGLYVRSFVLDWALLLYRTPLSPQFRWGSGLSGTAELTVARHPSNSTCSTYWYLRAQVSILHTSGTVRRKVTPLPARALPIRQPEALFPPPPSSDISPSTIPHTYIQITQYQNTNLHRESATPVPNNPGVFIFLRAKVNTTSNLE